MGSGGKKEGPSDALRAYLIAYNLANFAGWLLVGARAVQAARDHGFSSSSGAAKAFYESAWRPLAAVQVSELFWK